MATRTNEMLESTKEIKAGYFYTFSYKAKTKQGTDASPVIYCPYAPPMSNLFSGINFHYFNNEMITKIILGMNSKQNILDDDIQHIFNGKELHDIFSNIGFGLREYNKINVDNCYRIRNKFVPMFFNLPSNFFMSNDEDKDIQIALEIGKNKGF